MHVSIALLEQSNASNIVPLAVGINCCEVPSKHGKFVMFLFVIFANAFLHFNLYFVFVLLCTQVWKNDYAECHQITSISQIIYTRSKMICDEIQLVGLSGVHGQIRISSGL